MNIERSNGEQSTKERGPEELAQMELFPEDPGGPAAWRQLTDLERIEILESRMRGMKLYVDKHLVGLYLEMNRSGPMPSGRMN